MADGVPSLSPVATGPSPERPGSGGPATLRAPAPARRASVTLKAVTPELCLLLLQPGILLHDSGVGHLNGMALVDRQGHTRQQRGPMAMREGSITAASASHWAAARCSRFQRRNKTDSPTRWAAPVDRADRSGGTLGTLGRLRKGGQAHRNSGFASSAGPAAPILKCNMELGRLRANPVSILVRSGLAWPMPSVSSSASSAGPASACWPVYHNHSKRTYGEGCQGGPAQKRTGWQHYQRQAHG